MRFQLTIDDKDSYKVLGQMIRYHRLRNHYSLRDLSALSNISHTLISNIEKAKVISNPDTMKELMKVLGITFINNQEIKEQFMPLYDEAFNYLFEYEYSKAKEVMEQLFENEKYYVDSIVASDYLALKYLYLALRNEVYGEYEENIKRFIDVYVFLNARQKQIFSFTFGVYNYNRGLYRQALEHFKKARVVGNRELDRLINVYIIKTYVKMYRFMDAVSMADTLINELETDLLYLRAMEVRLSIVYSYIIVKKFDDAFELLDKVYRFAKNYNTIFILNECHLLYAGIYFNQGRYDLAEIKINQITENTMFIYYMKMKLAYLRQDYTATEMYINNYYEKNMYLQFKKSEYTMDIVLNDLGIREYEEKELIKRYNYLLKFGKEAADLEMIDSTYSLYINYCKKNRQYKKALELSEEARHLRKFGVNSRKVYK